VARRESELVVTPPLHIAKKHAKIATFACENGTGTYCSGRHCEKLHS